MTLQTILVVDDSSVVLESVKRALAGRFEVRTCDDPILLPNSLMAGDPVDLILMDVNMPGLSGPAAVAGLRGIGLQTARVVLYSSEPRDVLERLVVESAVSGAISKSAPLDLLADELARFLEETSLAGMEAIVFARSPLKERLGTELGRLAIQTELHEPLGVDRRIRSSSAKLILMEAAAFKNCAERLARLRKRGALDSRRLLLIGACLGETCLAEEELDQENLARVLTELVS